MSNWTVEGKGVIKKTDKENVESSFIKSILILIKKQPKMI